MIELRIATATVGTTTIIHMSASVPGVMSTKVKSPGVGAPGLLEPVYTKRKGTANVQHPKRTPSRSRGLLTLSEWNSAEREDIYGYLHDSTGTGNPHR